jgi:hypothetical protein
MIDDALERIGADDLSFSGRTKKSSTPRRAAKSRSRSGRRDRRRKAGDYARRTAEDVEASAGRRRRVDRTRRRRRCRRRRSDAWAAARRSTRRRRLGTRHRRTEPRNVDAAGGLFGAPVPGNPKLSIDRTANLTLVARALREQRRALVDAANGRASRSSTFRRNTTFGNSCTPSTARAGTTRRRRASRVARATREGTRGRGARAYADRRGRRRDSSTRRTGEHEGGRLGDARVGNLITEVPHDASGRERRSSATRFRKGTSNPNSPTGSPGPSTSPTLAR